MAENEAPLEPHIFQSGMDPHEASSKLEGLLSDENLEGDLSAFGGSEESESDDDEPAGVEDQDEQEEEAEGEEPEDEARDEWDDEDEYEYEEDDEEPELYAVKVDGEEQMVSLEELLNGYSFQAHNTRKAQQLAEERKAFEAETAETRQSRDRYQERLQKLEETLTEMTPQEPDWEALEKENPQRFAVEHAKWQRHQRDLATLKAEREKVQQDQMEDYTRQLQEYRAREGEALIEAIPEWREQDALKKGASEVADYARGLGFSDEEINQVMDHRAILMMRKAMLYDRSQARGKKKLKGKKRPASQTLKPGTSRARRKKPSKRVQEARRRVRETGTVKEASRFLETVLPDDF